MDKFIKIFSAVFTLLGALFFFPGLYLLWRFGIAVIAFPLVGFVFMIVGLSFLLGARAAAAKLRKLRETGERIDADIIGVQWNTSLRVNGQCPLVICCQAVNPANGKVYVFRSKNVWYDPTPFIEHLTTLPVYVDAANWKRYAVDTDGILPEQG